MRRASRADSSEAMSSAARASLWREVRSESIGVLFGQDDRIFRLNGIGIGKERCGGSSGSGGTWKTEHEQTLGLKKKTAGAW